MTTVWIYEGECPECGEEHSYERRAGVERAPDKESVMCGSTGEIVEIPFKEALDL